MIIEDGRVVSMHYQLKNDAGEVISASTDNEPLVFKYGTGAIIPGLEKELTGRKAGDEFAAVIPPEEGYGEINPCLHAVLKKEAFSGIEEIKPGMQFQTEDDNGNTQVIKVISVEGEKITVDRNHPLAGKTLFFDIEVLTVTSE